MNSEFADKILREAGVDPETSSADFTRLMDHGTLRTEFYLKGVTPFRKWLKEQPDIGKRFPGEGFYRAFLGKGEQAATALLNAYVSDAPPPDATDEGRRRQLEAIVLAPRMACALELISWNLDRYRPDESDSKERIGLYVAKQTAERARVASFAAQSFTSRNVPTESQSVWRASP